MNCHMKMQGCIFCGKPGVGLMLAHRHHPVSTGYPANAMHRGVVVPAGATHWTGVGLLLGRRLRRWPSIGTALVQCVAFAKVLMLGHNAATTLAQHWVDGGLIVFASSLFGWKPISQRTQCVWAALVWRWASVVDVGPALSRR